jgi:hypothetical protein
VAFAGAGFALTSPLGRPIEGWLHALTDLWDLGALVGDMLIIGTCAAFGYAMLSRAIPPDELERKSPWLLRMPAAISAATMIVIYIGGDICASPEAMESPHPTAAVELYWVVFCGITLYLLGGTVLTLYLLCRIPRHRPVAKLYLIACACGIAAAVARLVVMFYAPEYFAAGELVRTVGVRVGCDIGGRDRLLVAAQDAPVRPPDASRQGLKELIVVGQLLWVDRLTTERLDGSDRGEPAEQHGEHRFLLLSGSRPPATARWGATRVEPAAGPHPDWRRRWRASSRLARNPRYPSA